MRACPGVFYSRDINITIAVLPIIISSLMIAMQSNLIVSLGMVGALSIVRFRTAIKNPLDLVYLFWTISAGIICGVGLEVLAMLLCIAVTLFIFVLQKAPAAKSSCVLVLRSREGEIDNVKVLNTLTKYGKKVKEKSRKISGGGIEVIYELMVSDKEALVKELKRIKNITDINLLSHDGEYRI